MTNERILFRLRVSAECCFFVRDLRATAVRRAIAFLACSPVGALRSLCFCCGDGPRAPARIRARLAGSDDMWIYESSSSARFRAAQPLLASRAVIFGTTVELRTLGCAILAAVER